MKSYGFYLHRSSKHLIWKNENGITVTTSKTPNGVNALKQAERTVKKVLQSRIH